MPARTEIQNNLMNEFNSVCDQSKPLQNSLLTPFQICELNKPLDFSLNHEAMPLSNSFESPQKQPATSGLAANVEVVDPKVVYQIVDKLCGPF